MPAVIEESKKKPSWQELMTQLESKVNEGQEKLKKQDEAIASARKAQSEYNEVVSEIEQLKSELQNSIGNIFTNESRAKVY